jgi:hypothetical protein
MWIFLSAVSGQLKARRTQPEHPRERSGLGGRAADEAGVGNLNQEIAERLAQAGKDAALDPKSLRRLLGQL